MAACSSVALSLSSSSTWPSLNRPASKRVAKAESAACAPSPVLQRPLVGEQALVALDAQAAGHRQRQQVGGDAAVVAAHLLDEAQRDRRIILGRFVAGDDDAGLGVAPDLPPAPEGVRTHGQQCGQRDQHAAVVLQQPPQALRPRRRGDDALGEAEHDGQAFARRQRPGQRQCASPGAGRLAA